MQIHILSSYITRWTPHKDILPITLRVGDGNVQPEEQPKGNGLWSTNPKVKNYGQHLARQVYWVLHRSSRGGRACDKPEI